MKRVSNTELTSKVHRILFSNKYRMMIFAFLDNPKNQKILTISNIHKQLCDYFGKETDYKNTYKHIKILEKEGFVNIHKIKKTQGSHSIISLKEKEASEIFYKMLDILSPGIINHKMEAKA